MTMIRVRNRVQRWTFGLLLLGVLGALTSCQTTFQDSVKLGPNDYLIVGSKEGFMHQAPAIWHLKDGRIVRVKIVEK